MIANKIRNVISGSLAGYGIASFICLLFLQSRWVDLAPRSPDLALNLYLKHNEHGSTVFFSPFQATSCALMFATSIPLFFLSGVVAPKKNTKFEANYIAARAIWEEDDPSHIRKPAFIFGATGAPFIIYFAGSWLVHWLNANGIVFDLG
ncbi:hypothetical protein [Rhizobium sp. BG4]|uniref:hypothetical protein n=1 Tax=unclassified Rhizobium TaxID=2613769 RepID=UPI00193E08FE|nr:hypothetical protein [Rhizobium sp. BG4]QRM42458.1 hypothetical protein F2982_02890 [Rhizobium sp. BG4]